MPETPENPQADLHAELDTLRARANNLHPKQSEGRAVAQEIRALEKKIAAVQKGPKKPVSPVTAAIGVTAAAVALAGILYLVKEADKAAEYPERAVPELQADSAPGVETPPEKPPLTEIEKGMIIQEVAINLRRFTSGKLAKFDPNLVDVEDVQKVGSSPNTAIYLTAYHNLSSFGANRLLNYLRGQVLPAGAYELFAPHSDLAVAEGNTTEAGREKYAENVIFIADGEKVPSSMVDKLSPRVQWMIKKKFTHFDPEAKILRIFPDQPELEVLALIQAQNGILNKDIRSVPIDILNEFLKKTEFDYKDFFRVIYGAKENGIDSVLKEAVSDAEFSPEYTLGYLQQVLCAILLKRVGTESIEPIRDILNNPQNYFPE